MADEPSIPDLIARHRAAYLRAVWCDRPSEAAYHLRIIDQLTQPDHDAVIAHVLDDLDRWQP